MTPKELRQAAECIAANPIVFGWSADSDNAVELANHILATVREDDDEPFDEAFGESYVPQGYFYTCINGYVNITQLGDDGSLCMAVGCKRPNTQGQFRKLCEGLGIPTKENHDV